jgi:CRP-like cAMP-binding protein
MPVFGGVSAEALALLLERSRTLEVRKGGFFFREGDGGNSAFVLEKGRITLLKRFRGEDYVLRSLEAGDCFGEVALLDFFPRSASVLAAEDCRALEFHARDLVEVAVKDLEQFSMIYMNLARELARRLREASELLFHAKVKYEDIAEHYEFRTT